MKIGKISQFLNIPITTIRFYEAEGILSPERNENGKYRDYSTWDVMNLLECIRYRNTGFSVKETTASLHVESIEYLHRLYQKQEEALEQQVKRAHQLHDHVQSQAKRLETLPYNIGNYWITKEPARSLLMVADCQDDGYGAIQCRAQLLAAWAQHLPFVCGINIVDPDVLRKNSTHRIESFALVADTSYLEKNTSLSSQETITIPATLALNTIVDSGTCTLIPLDQYAKILKYAEKHYHIGGNIIAEFVARCGDERHPHRYWQVMIPVQMK